jgi:N,N'-diacetyllegionaminate synthase
MAQPRTITVGGRLIGCAQPAFVIAEAGVNHNADLGLAKALADAARAAGADAVKYQVFSAERLATGNARRPAYARHGAGGDGSLRAMLEQLELPLECFSELKAHCDQTGIAMLATPYDEDAVDFIARLGCPAMKIGSTDNNNPRVLRRAAKCGLPVLLSTGMCTLSEVARAVEILREHGAAGLAVLACTTAYPSPLEDANLRQIPAMAHAFGVPVGLSDHMAGIHGALAAVALGACIIEKHLTLSRDLPGPDQKASLEPGEFAELVRQVHEVELALGDGVKRVTAPEAAIMPQVRRFVVAASDLEAGHCLQPEDIALKRSGGGIPPHDEHLLVGKVLVRSVPADEPITWEDIGVRPCAG